MTEETKDTKDTKDTKEGDESKVTAGTLRDFIREEIVKLMPGKPSKDDTESSSKDGGSDVKAQVTAALQHLKDKEKRDQRDAEIDVMLEKYKKPPEETQPVERRRVEKWMRWAVDGDK